MFDLATRPQPARDAAAVFGVPFDLRLTAPAPASTYPWSDYGTGLPVPQVDVLETFALQLEDTLQTAVILSLFTDARAGRDDVLPLNQTNRRGWVGDEFMGVDGVDAWGSLLWLVYIGKATADALETAQFYAHEALAWMVRDGIASRVEATAQWVGPNLDRLAVRPVIYRPDQVAPVYDVLWGTSVRRWNEGGLA